ncbi:MAG: alpha/beta family hydrolase [Jatrophihabitantaceae bacterium]
MRLEIPTPAGVGWIDLDRPRGARALLALTHGAGGGVETPDLLAIRSAAVEAGIAVALLTQPYRVAGRRTPPTPGPQDAAWTALIEALRARRGLSVLPLVVGGRSNGARVACRTAVRTGASAVVALAFPLHPPGRPEKSRLDELVAAGVPTLVVQGDRDAFGLPPKGKGRRVVVVAGADHSLKRDTSAVARAVTSFLSSVGVRAVK